jgi:hypothetical protein
MSTSTAELRLATSIPICWYPGAGRSPRKRQRAVHVDETSQHLSPYEIDEPSRQIDEKGYAITSVMHQVEGSRQDAP